MNARSDERPGEDGLTIHVELSGRQAWALAEFFKRVGFNDMRPLAVDEQEAYDMIYAGARVRKALAEQGIAPR